MNKDNKPDDYEFSEQWHKDVAPTHSGKQGHYCLEWDDMYICEDCMEFRFCYCFGYEPGELSKCCNGRVTVEGDVTKYYVCEKCKEACNLKEEDIDSELNFNKCEG